MVRLSIKHFLCKCGQANLSAFPNVRPGPLFGHAIRTTKLCMIMPARSFSADRIAFGQRTRKAFTRIKSQHGTPYNKRSAPCREAGQTSSEHLALRSGLHSTSTAHPRTPGPIPIASSPILASGRAPVPQTKLQCPKSAIADRRGASGRSTVVGVGRSCEVPTLRRRPLFVGVSGTLGRAEPDRVR